MSVKVLILSFFLRLTLRIWHTIIFEAKNYNAGHFKKIFYNRVICEKGVNHVSKILKKSKIIIKRR